MVKRTFEEIRIKLQDFHLLARKLQKFNGIKFHFPAILANCIERATALGDRKIIDVHDLPPAVLAQTPAESLNAATTPSAPSSDLEAIERATIQRVFEQVKGDKGMAGRMLGISRATLYRKLKRYSIGPQQELSSETPRLQ